MTNIIDNEGIRDFHGSVLGKSQMMMMVLISKSLLEPGLTHQTLFTHLLRAQILFTSA
jgi:hypothetical protein